MKAAVSLVATLALSAALCGCSPAGTLATVSSTVHEADAGTSLSASQPAIGTERPARVSASVPVPALVDKPKPVPPASSASAFASAALTSASATKSPAASTGLAFSRSRPVRIRIPAIGVDSSRLLDLGLQDDGTMQVPPDAASLGWFTGAPSPGEVGPAVIVGHVDWAGEHGSFYDLGNVKLGDTIAITREDGSGLLFRVVLQGQYSKDRFPTNAVYANTDHPALRLVTCGGEFDRTTGNYLDNIIVFADMVARE